MPTATFSPIGPPTAGASAFKVARVIWLSVALGLCAMAAAITVTVDLIVLSAQRQSRAADALVEHSHQVIAALSKISSSADDAETGQRGFLLTQDARFLESYRAGADNIWQDLAAAQQLTADNPGQQKRLRVLQGLLQSKMAVLVRTIDLARSGHWKGATDIVAGGEGKALMDAIRAAISDMVAEETRLLQVRRTDNWRAQEWLDDILVATIGFSYCGALFGGAAAVRAFVTVAVRKRFAATAAERLRLLEMLDFAPIIIGDINGTIIFWSDGCHRLYGWTAEQAIGKSSEALLKSAASQPSDEIEAELLAKGKWIGELRQRTKNDAEVIVLATKSLCLDPHLGGFQVRETHTDLTALRHTETRLAATLSQFHSVVDAAADAILIADADRRIQTVNLATLRMFGYDRMEELVGQDISILMPSGQTATHAAPDHAAADHAAYLDRLRSDADQHVTGPSGREQFATRRDGSEFTAEVSLSAFDAGGQRCFTGVIRDISSRQQAEMALRASEARLRLFVDDAPAAIAMFDTAMCYIAASRRFVSDYQIADQVPLLGRSHYEVFPEIPESWRMIHRRVLAGEKMSADEQAFARADGHINWLRWEMVPWRRYDGMIGGAILFSEDISKRKLVETALRDSNARLRLVQQVGGIAHFDRLLSEPLSAISGEMTAIYGLPPEQTHMSPDEWVEWINPDDRDRVAKERTAFLAVGGTLSSEFRICRTDGTLRWVTLRAEIFPPLDGGPARIVCAQQDITEIVNARETLAARQRELEHTNVSLGRLARHLEKARDLAEQANRAKSRFLAGMSHELRTPLNGILGYAQLLHLEGSLSPTQSARVNAMLGAGQHLLEMITCVLDLSEIEADHVTLQPVEVEPQTIAAACIDLLRPPADEKGLSLSLTVAAAAPRKLVVDPTRLRQVLLNLLGNAVKFTSKGAVRLNLGMSADSAAMRIEVVDTGPGIAGDQRDRLFQEFERINAENSPRTEGAGLGLALSARLAALMGGRLGYDDNPGGGSVFWLELPINTAAVLPNAAPPAKTPSQQALPLTPALHVLVVDDVLMNRDIASSFLRHAGHRTTCVEGGAEAIEAVATTDFDVVLMDVRMPEMDGLEATRRIRALEGERGRVPIIALTALAFTDQIAECRKAGMDSHLAKPFDLDALLAAVVLAVRMRSRPDTKPSLDAPSTGGPVCVTQADPLIGSDHQVFEVETFQRTAAFLTPEAIASYLRTILAMAENLLHDLAEPDAFTSNASALGGAAHELAGAAGMFGFERLAALGLRFEQAAETGAADVPAVAGALRMAIEAIRAEIHTRTLPRLDGSAKAEH